MKCFTFHTITRCVCKLSALRDIGVAVLGVLLATTFAAQYADAVIQTSGELIVDLRAADLYGGRNVWVNHDTTGDTVGDFKRLNTQNLSVAANVSDGTKMVPYALWVKGQTTNALVADILTTPASIIGNNSRSAEAWVFSQSGAGSQSPVGWGQSGADQDFAASWSDSTSNGFINLWQNDSRWGTAAAPLPTTATKWTHVAWTYDGATVRGYRDGVFSFSFAPLDRNSDGTPLATTAARMSVGGARTASANAVIGYLADVRVHSGVLSDAQILNNFNEGIYAVSGLSCDFDGNGACNSTDLNTLRANMFTNGDVAQGDVDRSGFIDWADYRLFKDHPNRIVGGAGAGSLDAFQVPEPATLVSLGLAAGAMAIVRRRAPAARK
jgi:hypothetical protein